MHQSNSARTRMTEGGRIVIPAPYRKALDIKPGDELIVQLDEGELRVYSRAEALKRLQDQVTRAVPEGVSLVEELLRERKKEAARE